MNMLPAILIMTPEYKRWLKQPSRNDLDKLAEQHGYFVSTYHHDMSGHNFVIIKDKNGSVLSKGRGKHHQDIFHYIDAIKLINKHVASSNPKTTV